MTKALVIGALLLAPGFISGADRNPPRFKDRARVAVTRSPTTPSGERVPGNHAIVAARSLLVRDPSVIEDVRFSYDPALGGAQIGSPNGLWGFPSILRRAVSLQGITNDVPLLAWLRSGLKNDLAPDASAYDAILGSWSTLEKAPFRLLAIVNRSDLAKFKVNAASPEDGFVRGAELRFEFGGINKATGKPVDFFIIVEFVLKNMSKAAFKIYLKKWLDLSSVGSLDRPSDLNNVLKDALATGVASARFRVLGQSKLNPARWPMREYGVTPSQVKLQALSRQLPPQEGCAKNETSPQLAWWVNQPVNVINALANQYEFSSPPHPDFCPGESTQPPRPSSIPTKSAAAVAQLPPFVFGTNVTVSPADVPLLQSRLALNSCTRCHQSATNTDFRHIFNRDRGKQSEVSGFLCGSSDCSTAASSGYFEVPSVGRFNDLLRRHVFMLAALQLDPTGTNWTEKLDGLNTYEVH